MATTKDPVCGMTVDTTTATERATVDGTTWYFCSADCRREFEANPQAYIGEGMAAEAGGGDDVELERHEPPYTKRKGIVAPKFGSAGSGGLEYERLPERHDEHEKDS
jgi:YHS domain-containing protein